MSADRTAAQIEALMDLRVRARNLAEGLITQDEVDAYLENLADDEDAAEWVDLPTIGAGEGEEEEKAEK